MAYRNTPYFVNLNGGFSGFNNPGGRVFWVAASGYTSADGIGPSDSNSGTSPQQPFSTIQKGLDSCTSGRGDIVAVLPGSYTLSAALTMTSADVTLCSAHPVAAGQYSPVIITAAASYTLNMIQVDADNCKIIGLGFEAGITGATDSEIIQLNSTNAASDIFGPVVANCFFDMTRAAGAANAAAADLDCIRVGLDASDRAWNAVITGNTIRGCDQDAISVEVGSGGVLIEGNHIYDGIGSELTRNGVRILALGVRVVNNRIMVGTNSDTVACVAVNVAAAKAVVQDNRLIAWGADTCAITVVNTATLWSHANFILAVATGNTIDYKTSATTPSANIDFQNWTNTNPILGTFSNPSVDGTIS